MQASWPAVNRSRAAEPAVRRELQELGARAVVVDGLDGIAVGRTVAEAGPEVIVHQMTALGGSQDLRHFVRCFAGTNELRTPGTRTDDRSR
ncbi:hypothetical protein ACU61A_17155 [Pseudonocardia sichuanensis]